MIYQGIRLVIIVILKEVFPKFVRPYLGKVWRRVAAVFELGIYYSVVALAPRMGNKPRKGVFISIALFMAVIRLLISRMEALSIL